MNRMHAAASRFFPGLLTETLRAARRNAPDPTIRELLLSIEAGNLRTCRATPAIYVATPRRFVTEKRLAEPNDAISMMLEFIVTVQEVCHERKNACRFVLSENLPAGGSEMIFFSHHTFTNERFARAEARGAQIWHFKAGDLPRTMTLDRRGFSGWSTLADLNYAEVPVPQATDAEVHAFFSLSRDAIRSANISKYPQHRTGDELRAGGPYVFVALQTRDDVVQQKAYMPMLKMLDLVIRRFLGSPYRIVIKRHPKCRDGDVAGALEAARALGSSVVITDASIHQILENAAAVFTVNSGVGSEAMIYEIPIYCFGAADYAPVAHQIRNEDDLLRLTSPLASRCSVEQQKRFYHFYRQIYQVTPGTNLRSRLENILAECRIRH